RYQTPKEVADVLGNIGKKVAIPPSPIAKPKQSESETVLTREKQKKQSAPVQPKSRVGLWIVLGCLLVLVGGVAAVYYFDPLNLFSTSKSDSNKPLAQTEKPPSFTGDASTDKPKPPDKNETDKDVRSTEYRSRMKDGDAAMSIKRYDDAERNYQA